MPDEPFMAVNFPVGGIDQSNAFAKQLPRKVGGDGGKDVYGRTTPTGTNVRGYEATTDRRRGGSRPGLVKFVPTALVAGWLIQDLNVVATTNSGAVA